MKCSVEKCQEQPTMTVRLKPFCDGHGKVMERINFIEGEKISPHRYADCEICFKGCVSTVNTGRLHDGSRNG